MSEAPEEEDYKRKVRERVRDCARGADASLASILAQVEGADPRLVEQCLKELRLAGHGLASPLARRARQPGDAAAYEDLPAADPLLGQWWYTSDTLDRLSRRVRLVGRSPLNVLCLGTPTIAPRLSESGDRITVVDADPDVLDVVEKYSGSAVRRISSDSLESLRSQVQTFDVCILDPPWYPEEMEAFFKLAAACVRPGGRALMSLPQLLTRPSVFREREQFLEQVSKCGHSVLFLERDCLRYVVPRFEQAAFQDIDGFSGRPWRQADLLELAIGSTVVPETLTLSPPLTAQRFSRPKCAREFRVFIRADKGPGRAAGRAVIATDRVFSQNVSRRAHRDFSPDVWTSEKTGATVEDLSEASAILTQWADGKSLEATALVLQKRAGTSESTSHAVCEKYDEVLGLWRLFAGGIDRRTDEEIAQKSKSAQSKWATPPGKSEYARSGDGFRSTFSRDRDRVVWSGSLRKLAAKTQLFPVQEGDQLRQRLAHSMEVMQLASTIGESFGLNRDLIEAGAIAHDIGHTPFGHAGEHALHTTLKRLNSQLPGFNHYEHGVDVVRYLEGPYQYPAGGGYPGLNLSPEVCECIFKHTYCHSNGEMSHEALRGISKHKAYLQDGYCHFEGQAVRLADKISYLISDLEDGIRLGAIDDTGLHACRLFHRPPIDLAQPEGENLLNRFLYQRRNILRVLMEDAISETSRRLTQVREPRGIRDRGDYLVSHSPVVAEDVSEVWKKLQVTKLHNDQRVVAANLKAAKIVSELVLLFAVIPELIDGHFYQEHQRLWQGDYVKYYLAISRAVEFSQDLVNFLPLQSYIGLGKPLKTSIVSGVVSVRMEELVAAKDYVASMTDDQARRQHGARLGSRLDSP